MEETPLTKEELAEIEDTFVNRFWHHKKTKEYKDRVKKNRYRYLKEQFFKSPFLNWIPFAKSMGIGGYSETFKLPTYEWVREKREKYMQEQREIIEDKLARHIPEHQTQILEHKKSMMEMAGLYKSLVLARMNIAVDLYNESLSERVIHETTYKAIQMANEVVPDSSPRSKYKEPYQPEKHNRFFKIVDKDELSSLAYMMETVQRTEARILGLDKFDPGKAKEALERQTEKDAMDNFTIEVKGDKPRDFNEHMQKIQGWYDKPLPKLVATKDSTMAVERMESKESGEDNDN